MEGPASKEVGPFFMPSTEDAAILTGQPGKKSPSNAAAGADRSRKSRDTAFGTGRAFFRVDGPGFVFGGEYKGEIRR